MTFCSLFAAVLILAASSNFTQAQTGSDSNQILAAERAWANAAVERKVDTFAKYLSDDYVLIAVNPSPGKKGEFELTNKPKWVEILRSGREKYEAVEIHNLKILVNGDVATVTGEYSQKGTRDGKDITDAGLYVDTWIKRNGQWQLVSSVFP